MYINLFCDKAFILSITYIIGTTRNHTMDTDAHTTIMMLWPEIIEMVLDNLDTATLTRISATCRGIQRNVISLLQHRERIRQHLEDETQPRRDEVLEALGELPPAVLEHYAATVVYLMRNSADVQVRLTALQTLRKLHRAVLAQYEDEIKGMLTRENQMNGINEQAMQTLCAISPEIVSFIMEMHTEDGAIQFTALRTMGTLDSQALAPYRDEIEFMLTQEHQFHGMQSTAMRTLYKIDPAIVVDIMIKDDGMKAVALRTLSMATLRHLEGQVKARLRNAVWPDLKDENAFVRSMAQTILDQIGLPLLPALSRWMRQER